jgi:hypothetical protein
MAHAPERFSSTDVTAAEAKRYVGAAIVYLMIASKCDRAFATSDLHNLMT